MRSSDKATQKMKIESDKQTLLRECNQACRKRGTDSRPGVYVGCDDAIPLGA